MFKLEKEKTGSTPHIIVDEEKKYMRFLGDSFPRNVSEYYEDITGWLDDYLKSNFGTFTFDCELQYFNSSTAKLLLNMLMDMDEASAGDNKVTVNWITTQENDMIIECGEDFSDEMRNLIFNLIIK